MLAAGAVNTDLAPLQDTGERMVPEHSGSDTFWEHVHRYAFACGFVRGKRVLDIACGEGYGSAALKKAGATSVTGIDISKEVCIYAQAKYGIDARPGSAEEIPLADNSVDVVVSFETIEHLHNPARFLDESSRVLVPGGRLVISTPNKGVYTRSGESLNPYHCSEMTEPDFLAALRKRFRRVKMHSQHPRSAPSWSPRVFAADKTPWMGHALFERIRRSAHFRLAPHTVYELTDAQRLSAVDQILTVRQRPFVNQHGVGGRLRWYPDEPMYLIATAKNR